MGPEGNVFLFVADTNNRRIRKFGIGGETPIAIADFRDPTDPLPGETDENGEIIEPHFYPLDVAITAAGEKWGRLGERAARLNAPFRTALAPDGILYVCDGPSPLLNQNRVVAYRVFTTAVQTETWSGIRQRFR